MSQDISFIWKGKNVENKHKYVTRVLLRSHAAYRSYAKVLISLSLNNTQHHLKASMAEYKEYYVRCGFKSDLTIGNVTFSHIDVKIAY